jgi:hypothetical protein
MVVKQVKSVANELLVSSRIAPELQRDLKKTVFVNKIPM